MPLRFLDLLFDLFLCSFSVPQAGAGVVADSVPEAEYEETVNKAAALGRAIDLAETAFLGSQSSHL
jgi:hypothetical protein